MTTGERRDEVKRLAGRIAAHLRHLREFRGVTYAPAGALPRRAVLEAAGAWPEGQADPGTGAVGTGSSEARAERRSPEPPGSWPEGQAGRAPAAGPASAPESGAGGRDAWSEGQAGHDAARAPDAWSERPSGRGAPGPREPGAGGRPAGAWSEGQVGRGTAPEAGAGGRAGARSSGAWPEGQAGRGARPSGGAPAETWPDVGRAQRPPGSWPEGQAPRGPGPHPPGDLDDVGRPAGDRPRATPSARDARDAGRGSEARPRGASDAPARGGSAPAWSSGQVAPGADARGRTWSSGQVAREGSGEPGRPQGDPPGSRRARDEGGPERGERRAEPQRAARRAEPPVARGEETEGGWSEPDFGEPPAWPDDDAWAGSPAPARAPARSESWSSGQGGPAPRGGGPRESTWSQGQAEEPGARWPSGQASAPPGASARGEAPRPEGPPRRSAPTRLPIADAPVALPGMAEFVGAPAPSSAPQPAAPVGDPALRAQAHAWTPAQKLEYLRAKNLGNCQRCKLGRTRTNIVFGVGDPEAQVMFIGEAPGADEDRLGEPFVGAAGRRLTQWIERLGMTRQQVYIANVLKCRPPNNRDPQADEVERCSPFLRAQIRAIRPSVLVALGRHAGMLLIGAQQETTLKAMRGRVWTYEDPSAGLRIPLYVTYHPSYVIRRERELPSGQRNPADDTVMSDLQKAIRVVKSTR